MTAVRLAWLLAGLVVLAPGVVRGEAAAGTAAVAPGPQPTMLRVTARTGLAVKGARISAPGAAPAERIALGVTGEDGTAPFPGDAPVRIEADGFLPFEGVAAAAVVLVRPSSIVVRVVDAASSRPVASAEVALFPQAPPAVPQERPRQVQGPPEPEPAPLATLKTGPDGRVEFKGLTALPRRLKVTAAGHVHGGGRAAPALEATDTVVIELEAAREISGRVHDGPKPLAGVPLEIVPAGMGGGRSPWAGSGGEAPTALSRDTLTTDAQGGFRLSDIPERLALSLVVVAAAPGGRFAVGVVEGLPLRLAGGGAERAPLPPLRLDLDVAGAQPLRGRVAHEDGTPAVGVPVVAHVPLNLDMGFLKRTLAVDLRAALPAPPATEVVTSDEGAFTFPALPARLWHLTAAPAGHAGSEPVTVDLAAGPAVDVQIVLPSGSFVTGRVTDRSLNPVAGARVGVREARPEGGGGGQGGGGRGDRGGRGGPFDASGVEVLTDAQGRFRAEGLTGERLRVVAVADGFSRAEVEAAAGSDVRVELSRSGSLAGRVVSARTGDPVARFTATLVQAGGDDSSPAFARRQARKEFTSAEGAFLLEGVEPGRHAVRLESDGFLALTTPVTEVAAGVEALIGDVVLSEGAVVAGSVVDAGTGEPVVGATARVEGLDALSGGGPGGGPGGGGGRGGLRALASGGRSEAGVATTDAEGRFRIGSVPPGDFTVTVSHAEYPAASSRVSIPDDPSGHEAQLVVKLSAGGSLLVRVFDAAGAPAAGVLVAAYEVSASRRSASLARGQSGADGTVLFEGLLPGPLSVLRMDRMEAHVEAIVKRGEIAEVELRDAGATVKGRFLLGTEPVLARVMLRAGGMRFSLEEPALTYSLEGVVPGTWELDVSFDEPRPDGTHVARRERDKVEVKAGLREVLHDIVLEPTAFDDEAVVAGSITAADTGRGLDGWTIQAVRLAASGEPQVSGTEIRARSSAGSFELRLPQDGAFQVFARPPQQEARSWVVPEPLRLQLAAGDLASPPPAFVVVKRLEVEVTVLDISGQPAPGAQCSLLQASRNLGPAGLRLGRMPAMTDAFGRATVTVDDAGTYDLLVVLPARALVFRSGVRVEGWSELAVNVPRVGSLHAPGLRTMDVVELATGQEWWIRVDPGSNAFGLGQVDESGATLHGLAAGTYLVRSGDSTRRVEVQPGSVTEASLGL